MKHNCRTPKFWTRLHALRQCLLWHRGRFVPYEVIRDVIWGGDEDGGPLGTRVLIRGYLWRLRKQGYEFEVKRGYGVKMKDGAG